MEATEITTSGDDSAVAVDGIGGRSGRAGDRWQSVIKSVMRPAMRPAIEKVLFAQHLSDN